MIRVKRYDVGRMDGPQVTPEGYLKAELLATRTGIFYYMRPDGTIVRELRHPDDVFDQESMNTLAGKVHTNDHPPEPLNADNTKRYSCGFLGETVERTPDDYIKVKTTITDSNLIKDITDNVKREVSCGYYCEMEETAGVYNGEAYDQRQRKIRYNHIASVALGRAGPKACIQMDSADAIMVTKKDFDEKNIRPLQKNVVQSKTGLNSDQLLNQTDGVKIMAKINIDGVEFEVADTAFAQIVAGKLDSLKKLEGEKAALENANKTLQGKHDAMESQVKEKDAKITKLESEKLDDNKIVAMAKPILELQDNAKKFLGDEKLDGLSQIDIKKKVLAKTNPETNFDGKDEAYIDGFYSAAIKTASATHSDASDVKKVFSDVKTKTDLAATREQMLKEDMDMHKLTLEEYNKKYA